MSFNNKHKIPFKSVNNKRTVEWFDSWEHCHPLAMFIHNVTHVTNEKCVMFILLKKLHKHNVVMYGQLKWMPESQGRLW